MLFNVPLLFILALPPHVGLIAAVNLSVPARRLLL